MSPETRDFLAAVRRAEDPGPSEQARVLGSLEAVLAAGSMAPPGGEAPPPAASSGVSASLKGFSALLGVSVGAALVAAAVSSAPSGAKPVSPSHGAATSVAPASAPAPASASTGPTMARPSAAVAAASSELRAARPAKSSSRAPSLRAEIDLLQGVQAALERGEGAEALRRLDAHVTTDTQLVAERRAARIAALCSLGNVAEARRLADVFRAENAGSVQRGAVERSCAGAKTPGER